MKRKAPKIICLCGILALLSAHLWGCGVPAPQTHAESSALSGEAAPADPYSESFFCMDTWFTLRADGENRLEAVAAARTELERLDALLSTGDPESEISRLNAAGTAALSEEAYALLSRAISLNGQTDGAFDVALYPVSALWGFTSGNYRVPEQEELAAALSCTDPSAITLREDICTVTLPEGYAVDLGGIGKGYASGQAIAAMREAGAASALINLGGNVHALGTKPDGSLWTVGIQDPANADALLATVRVSDTAVITSGAYERYFEEDGIRYHHILDPATGYPADSGLASVTVVSADSTLADALSTALFVLGFDRAVACWREDPAAFDLILFTAEGKLYATEGISSSISSKRTVEVIQP